MFLLLGTYLYASPGDTVVYASSGVSRDRKCTALAACMRAIKNTSLGRVMNGVLTRTAGFMNCLNRLEFFIFCACLCRHLQGIHKIRSS